MPKETRCAWMDSSRQEESGSQRERERERQRETETDRDNEKCFVHM